MAYTKQQWNQYDKSKSIEENIANDAVITPSKMKHIEDGIVLVQTEMNNENEEFVQEVNGEISKVTAQLAQKATESYVQEQIVNVNTGGTVDISTKADVAYVDEIKNKDTKRPLTQITQQIVQMPKFNKYTNNPIFKQSDSSWLVAGNWKMYWPWVINAKDILGSNALDTFYMYYSSDHAQSSGGIGVATAPEPFGPWTDYGLIYSDTVDGGRETETPCVVFNDKTGLFHMYYQQLGLGKSQLTCLATSLDGINWTRYGIVLNVNTEPDYPGDGHTGYARVFRTGERWICFHLMGGTFAAHMGVSYSDDGKNWETDPRPISSMADMTEDSFNRRIELNEIFPLVYKGVLLAVVPTSPFVAGQVSGGKEINIYVMHHERSYTHRTVLVPTGQTGKWDQTGTKHPSLIEYKNKLYLFYSSDGINSMGAFGVTELEGLI